MPAPFMTPTKLAYYTGWRRALTRNNARWRRKQADLIVRFTSDGWAPEDVAYFTGLRPKTVHAWLRRGPPGEAPLWPRIERKRHLYPMELLSVATPAQRVYMADLAAGFSISEVARKQGVSRQAVWHAICRLEKLTSKRLDFHQRRT